jgi:hypothetical protein
MNNFPCLLCHKPLEHHDIILSTEENGWCCYIKNPRFMKNPEWIMDHFGCPMTNLDYLEWKAQEKEWPKCVST